MIEDGLSILYIENGLSRELKRSLNYVILGVTFGMVCFTITGGSALTGYARELGAGDFIYGILMAMPVVGGVVQLYASYLLEKTGKRKSIFLTFGVVQRLLWIPIALVPYIVPSGINFFRIWSVILLITISSMSGAFVNVSFYSWMSDLIPINIRGRYFSIRSRFSTMSGLLAGFAAAWILDRLSGFTGYTVVFVISGIFGTADILSFIKVRDIPMKKPESHISMLKAIKESFSNTSFRKYVLFWTAWGFAINMSSPYFNMYALGPLKMSFMELTVAGQLACNLTTIFFITKWGRFLDRYGSKPVLYITCIGTALLPILWLFASPGHYVPILLFNLIGGAIWCGTDITNQNMLISNIPEDNRSTSIAVYFVITSLIGNALAYVAGGFFLEQVQKAASEVHFSGITFNHYEVLFILTSLMRLASVFIFLPGISENRSAPMKAVYAEAARNMKNQIQRIRSLK